MNADETVSGLMARALLDGNVSTFYWEQQYGGTVEIIPFAVLVGAIDDRAAIVVLPLVESRSSEGCSSSSPADGSVGSWPSPPSPWRPCSQRRRCGSRTRAMLFYQPVIIAGLGALVLAEQLAEDDVDRRGRAWRWVGIGLLLGVGWWTSTQVVFFAIPAVVWLVLRRASTRGSALFAGGGLDRRSSTVARAQHPNRGRSLRELPGGSGSYVDHLVTRWRPVGRWHSGCDGRSTSVG